jgi:hypothetical protein
MVEFLCKVSTEFEVLSLIFSDRNKVSVVKKDIGSHEHRIAK